MEFFKILGIDPPRLQIDSKDLEKQYYELSLKYHPDRNRSGACSVDLSAKLNEAYKTLREPWARTEYLLEHSGVVIDSKVPPRLAELYFELQESDDRSALENLWGELKKVNRDLDADLKRAFENFDSASQNKLQNLNILKGLVTEHSYAKSMLRDLEQKLNKSDER